MLNNHHFFIYRYAHKYQANRRRGSNGRRLPCWDCGGQTKDASTASGHSQRSQECLTWLGGRAICLRPGIEEH